MDGQKGGQIINAMYNVQRIVPIVKIVNIVVYLPK